MRRIRFEAANKSFVVTEESMTSIKFDGDGQLVGGDKLDPVLPQLGALRRLRAARDRRGARHGVTRLSPLDWSTLRFERAESPAHALCFKRVRRSEVEDLRTTPAPDPAFRVGHGLGYAWLPRGQVQVFGFASASTAPGQRRCHPHLGDTAISWS